MKFSNQVVAENQKRTVNDFIAEHKGGTGAQHTASRPNYKQCFSPKSVLAERFSDENIAHSLCFSKNYIDAKNLAGNVPEWEFSKEDNDLLLLDRSLFLDANKGRALALYHEDSSVYFGASDSYHDKDSIFNLNLDGLALYLSCVGDNTLRNYGDIILDAINNAVISEARTRGKIDDKLYADYAGIYFVAKNLIEEKTQNLNTETNQTGNIQTETSQTQTRQVAEDKTQKTDIVQNALPPQENGASSVNQENSSQGVEPAKSSNQQVVDEQKESVNSFVSEYKGNPQAVTRYRDGKVHEKCFSPKNVLAERFSNKTISTPLCFSNDYVAAKESICYAPGKEIPYEAIDKSLFLDPNKGQAVGVYQEGSNIYFGAAKDSYHDRDSIFNLNLDGLALYLSCVGTNTLSNYGDVILDAINNAVISEARASGMSKIDPKLYADYTGIYSVAQDLIEQAQSLNEQEGQTETAQDLAEQAQAPDNIENVLPNQEEISIGGETFVVQADGSQMEASTDLKNFSVTNNQDFDQGMEQ